MVYWLQCKNSSLSIWSPLYHVIVNKECIPEISEHLISWSENPEPSARHYKIMTYTTKYKIWRRLWHIHCALQWEVWEIFRKWEKQMRLGLSWVKRLSKAFPVFYPIVKIQSGCQIAGHLMSTILLAINIGTVWSTVRDDEWWVVQ